MAHNHNLIHIYIHNLDINMDIHMSETGHMNGGQQFGGGFDQQEHAQYPSGPRSISLQVGASLWQMLQRLKTTGGYVPSAIFRTLQVAVEPTTHQRPVVQAGVC